MVNRLLSVGDRFRAKYKTITGKDVLGQMLDIPDTSRVSNFLSARRYFRVRPNSNLLVGDILVVSGQQFIVAEHGTGFYKEPIYRHHKLFEVDQALEWRQALEYPNPVTGISETRVAEEGETVYLSIQPKSSLEDRVHIPQEQLVALCNQSVAVGDVVGDYLVTKSDHVLGIYLLEMKKL